MDVSTLSNNFNTIASKSVCELDALRSRIETGFAPTKEDIEGLTNLLSSLSTAYDHVREAVVAIADDSAVGSVPDMTRAAREILSDERKLSELRETLEAFVKITAKGESYAEILAPFQETAKEKVLKLSMCKPRGIPDDVLEFGESVSLFLRIVAMDDKSGEEAEELLDKLVDVYPTKVHQGLMLGKYLLTEDASEKEKVISPPEALDKAASVRETVIDSKENMVGEQYFLTPVNPIVPKNIGAKAFLRDISAIHARSDKILALFTWFGCLTAEQVSDFFAVSQKRSSAGNEASSSKMNFTSVLERLEKKHCLASYVAPFSKTPLYCLTPYACSCLRLESVAKGKHPRSKSEIPAHDKISARELEVRYTANNKLLEKLKCYEPKQASKIFFTIRWNTETLEYIAFFPNTEPPEDNAALDVPGTLEDLPIDNESNNSAGVVAETAVEEESELVMYAPEEDSKTPAQELEIKSTAVQPEEPSEEIFSNTDQSPENLALALTRVNNPSDGALEKLMLSLIERGRFHEKTLVDDLADARYLGFAVSKSGEGFTKSVSLYRKLCSAMSLPCLTRSEELASLFDEPNEGCEGLYLASLISAVFSMAAPDYILKTLSESILREYEGVFPSYPKCKPVLSDLAELFSLPRGFTARVLASVGGDAERNEKLNSLAKAAENLLTIPRINQKMSGIPEFLNALFGVNSDLYKCVKIISGGRSEDRAVVEQVVAEYYTNEKIDDDKINEKIELHWRNASWGKTTAKIRKLIGALHDKLVNALQNRISVAREWLDVSITPNEHNHNTDAYKRIKSKLDKSLDSAIDDLESARLENGAFPIVSRMLSRVRTVLKDGAYKDDAWPTLLRTGIISCDESGAPIFFDGQSTIKYWEPWRLMCKHISTPVRDLIEVRKDIFNDSSRAFDNLGQLRSLELVLDKLGISYESVPSDLEQSKKDACLTTKEFQESLVLSCFKGHITEEEEETLEQSADVCKNLIFGHNDSPDSGTLDYGVLRQFLNALYDQISDCRASVEKRLRTEIEERFKRGAEGTAILDAAKELIKEQRFSLAEDYINRFDLGETEPPDTFAGKYSDDYGEFLSNANWARLQKFCDSIQGFNLSQTRIDDFVKRYCPSDWSHGYVDDSRYFLANWLKGSGINGEQIKNYLTKLGLKIKTCTKEDSKDKKCDLFLVSIEATPRKQQSYSHPISAFGTDIHGLYVICFYGNWKSADIVDKVAKMNLSGLPIVLLDGVVNRDERRKIAEIIRLERAGRGSFLLIDRALTLFLATKDPAQRLPSFLKCTLPYARYQPFVRDGGATADEMFSGRAKELHEILDPYGCSLVYGGRQLGKTALLQRAESLASKRDLGEYACLISLGKSCPDETTFSRTVSERLKEQFPNRFEICDSIHDLCREIRKLLNDKKVMSLLLLLDEADTFLDGISQVNYDPLEPLVHLKRDTRNSFRFVLAGVHNVCRAKNAMSGNGVLGQLGTPVCVKPLTVAESVELLAKPLSYLGFKPDDMYNLQSILPITNYYPGILQFFGYELVQTLSTRYGRYFSAESNPPFPIKDQQIGAVISGADLNKSIRDKFMLTLRLDPRYLALARCVAALYYLEEDKALEGFSANTILKVAIDEFSILCLVDETETSCQCLLDEMTDMAVLSSRNVDGSITYRLRKRSFLDLLGNNFDVICDAIEKEDSEMWQ